MGWQIAKINRQFLNNLKCSWGPKTVRMLKVPPLQLFLGGSVLVIQVVVLHLWSGVLALNVFCREPICTQAKLECATSTRLTDSKRRGTTFKGFEDFEPKAKARILP
jgi:hypothetical protein